MRGGLWEAGGGNLVEETVTLTVTFPPPAFDSIPALPTFTY